MRQGTWPYYSTYDVNGLIWCGTGYRAPSQVSFSWYDPSNGDTGYYDTTVILSRSIGIAKGRTKVLLGDNSNNIYVINIDTKAIENTITLTGYYGQVIVADVSDGAEVLVLSTDASTNHILLKVNIDTEVITEYTLPAGFPFGYYSSSRIHIRFPKGPDGEYYLFLGTHLYSVDLDGNFTDLGDFSDYWMVTFAGRDVLLNDPSDTSLRVIYDMFWQTSGAGGIGTQATAGGIPGAKVGGLG
jgi:hypothetical protein